MEIEVRVYTKELIQDVLDFGAGKLMKSTLILSKRVLMTLRLITRYPY